MRVLHREYKERAWVDGLSGREVYEEYGELIRLKTVDLREQLNVLVTAAAVSVDHGKAAQELDEKLEAATRRPGQPSPAERAAQEAPPDPRLRPATTEEQDEYAAKMAANAGLWAMMGGPR